MKKVYILYGRVSTFQKLLGIFSSKETAKRYEVIVHPLKDIDIPDLEYAIEEYQVITDEDIDSLQSSKEQESENESK